MAFIYTEKVRFIDMNAGNHVSNDKILVYLTECTDSFFRSIGYHLGDFLGSAFVFAEVNVKYIREIKYPNAVSIHMSLDEITEARILFTYKCYDSSARISNIAKIKCALFSIQERKVVNISQQMIDVLKKNLF